MTSSTAEVPVRIKPLETGAVLGQTMALVALTTGLFALGAFLGRNTSGGWAIAWFVAALAILLSLNVVAQRSEQLAVGLLFGFGLLLGLAVAPAIAGYASADPRALWEAGGATGLFIAGVGAVGYATRRDLAGIARASFWVLVGLIAFGFAGLTLYDFQRLRQTNDIRSAPQLAASIFLDALNVFLLLLSLFGGEER
jgi:FtsH-binding integral membrane protein